MSTTVTVAGADRVADTLRAAGRQIASMTPAHAAIGAELVNLAAGRVPNRSGRGSGSLARSIRADAAPLAVTIRPGRVYAAVIENGHAGVAGQPGPHNVRPARYMASARDRAPAIAAEKVGAAVDAALSTVKGV